MHGSCIYVLTNDCINGQLPVKLASNWNVKNLLGREWILEAYRVTECTLLESHDF